jgi:CXXX repeat modification system protein
MMNQTYVGRVTEAEKKEILKLHERRLALAELLLTLNTYVSETEKEEIYEKVVADAGKTRKLFDEWWSRTASKYGWASNRTGWVIQFDTGEIFLKNGEPNDTAGCSH